MPLRCGCPLWLKGDIVAALIYVRFAQKQTLVERVDHFVGDLLEMAGTSRLSALAVLRLITSSNLVGCSTGKSAD
jgi:hypothetical protein